MTATALLPPHTDYPQLPPPWAERFGEDDFGIFAEFSLEAVVFTLRWIPPGEFRMGAPKDEEGRFGNDGPQHRVVITKGFWLGETPVTQVQWRAVMETDPSHFKGDLLPVESVDWHDCQKFSTHLNLLFPKLEANLPSEAQWEYACRAETETAFNNNRLCTKQDGKDPALDEVGWHDKNSGNKTHPVKQKRPNNWGLYDMHGNVWEWCRDAWEEKEYANRPDGIEDPESLSTVETVHRVVRGGSWFIPARLCRAAYRGGWEPGGRGSDLGFRLFAGQELRAAEPQGAERPRRRGGAVPGGP